MRVIFTKKFWLDSLNNFKSVKSIALMGVLLAMLIVLSGLSNVIYIKIFDRKLSFAFLMWPIIGCLFGPIPSIILALVSDVLVFFIFPTGFPFYVGYTITLMINAFISSILFYKQNITILKVCIYKIFVNFVLHVGIESFFMKDIMKYNDEAFKTYVIGGLIKNSILLPIEVVMIILILNALFPIFHQFKLIEEEINRIERIV